VTKADISDQISVRDDVPESVGSNATSPAVFLMTDSFETGGSERQFVELARSLYPGNYRVHLGCIQTRGPFRKDVGQVAHFPLGGSLYGIQSMRARYRLAAHLRRTHIAIAHAFDYYTNLALIPAARFAGTPVVVASLRQLGDLLTPLQRWSQILTFHWSDCVICNSKAAADVLVKGGFDRSRVAIIGNGLPASAFVEPMPRGPGTFRVGMIARMNARSKNHHFLLKVAARLLSKSRHFEFFLVGDGPLREQLELQAKELRIADAVHFLGNRQDVPAILATLDAVVLPSASESLSNAILESMAAGVPVIANRIGGNIELLDDDRGILVSTDDEAAWVAALEKIANDIAFRESLGRSSKRFAEENFTAERTRDKYEQLYAVLLEQKRWRAQSFDTGI
jgi:L-malate glycosyltransferase